MESNWKLPALALATTFGLTYIICAIYDALFPPYGMLQALAPVSPWPIYGSLAGWLLGFITFTVLGFYFGALYGAAYCYWNKKT